MLCALLSTLAIFGTCPDETVAGYVPQGAIYRLAELDGAPYAARATMGFPGAGQIAGQAPCNSYSGRLSAPLPWFGIGPLAVTRRACPELAQEAAFLAALQAMTLAEVSGDVLILSDDSGREMVFRAE